MVKTPFHTRFSDEAVRLLKLLAQTKGVSQTAILEMAIRELARKEGIS